MKRPNIFNFATKELSQDAFICWLLSWADSSCQNIDDNMHKLGLYFLHSLLSKKGVTINEIQKVQIRRQKEGIDISVIINDEYIIVIEDKIFSKKHGNQLKKYYEIASKKFNEDKIITIFLKTSYSGHYHNENYELFLLNDFLEIIEYAKKIGANDRILLDFAEVLLQRVECIEEYQKLKVRDWGLGWMGFLKKVQENCTEWSDWGYIQNQSGGFWALWTHFIPVNESNTKEIHIHLRQVKGNDDAKILFSITLKKDANKTLKYIWLQKFITAGKEAGIEVRKVNRLGDGKHIAIAEYVGKVIHKEENGEILIGETIKVIATCIKTLDISAK